MLRFKNIQFIYNYQALSTIIYRFLITKQNDLPTLAAIIIRSLPYTDKTLTYKLIQFLSMKN